MAHVRGTDVVLSVKVQQSRVKGLHQLSPLCLRPRQRGLQEEGSKMSSPEVGKWILMTTPSQGGAKGRALVCALLCSLSLTTPSSSSIRGGVLGVGVAAAQVVEGGLWFDP